MNGRLQHFPIAFFAAVMGLSGLSMALLRAQNVLGLAVPAGEFVALIAAAVFVVLSGFYLTKMWLYRSAVVADLNHPVRMSFSATFSVSLLLLSVLALRLSPALSALLWTAGAVLHLALTVYVLNAWIYQPRFEINHITPAWFIPVVGNIVAPIAGVYHGGHEVSWFFFSIGVSFWLLLFVIIIYRMIFHHPLPEKLLPTLFILIAPPAVGFLAYLRLTGEVDAFARVLYYTALFLTLWLLLQLRRFLRLPFFLSWWAYSFPLAAVTTATIEMYAYTGESLLKVIGYLLLFLLIAVIGWLIVRTIVAVRRNQICVPEG